ncbi:MAG: isoprenylcysteine carboxylmethyltransferase family protein [Actinomycetota bacterium]|nr:isoprenylcysteine carboxylmethyltransferase family protein [Actinomycetota bacterium]
MDPAVAALSFQVLFAAIAFGWRSVQQWQRTGSTGFVAHRERGAAAKAAGIALTAGVVLLVAGTAVVERATWEAREVAGILVMVAGFTVTLVAQRAMKDSWRIGVHPTERTELVSAEPFAWVRNPVFTGMLTFAAGTLLVVPSRLTACGAAALVVGIVAQVLLVEEPHLRFQHGAAYDAYVTRSGRFLPASGEVEDPRHPSSRPSP